MRMNVLVVSRNNIFFFQFLIAITSLWVISCDKHYLVTLRLIYLNWTENKLKTWKGNAYDKIYYKIRFDFLLFNLHIHKYKTLTRSDNNNKIYESKIHIVHILYKQHAYLFINLSIWAHFYTLEMEMPNIF